MNPHEHHDLDRQMMAAFAGAPSTDDVARMEEAWRRISRRERRMRTARYATAMAAALLIAATAVFWLSRGAQEEPIAVDNPALVVPTPEPPEPAWRSVPQLAGDSTVDAIDAPKQARSSAGRPPTAYERLAFMVGSRKSARAKSRELAAAIEALIGKIALNPQVDAKALLETAGASTSEAERLLIERLQRSPERERGAVVKLLSVCGTSRALPALVRAGSRGELRDEALAAIELIVGTVNLPDMILQTPDPVMRAAMFDRLVTGDDQSALRGYLSLVSDDALRAEALAAADRVARPPIGGLLPLLKDGDREVRLAAAVALGRMNGPEVTAALIALVSEAPSGSTEAWVALWACRGESAEQFLADASRRPQMLGHVNQARMFWERMTP